MSDQVIPMTDQLISAIQASLADGADDLARQRGADACRSLLAALESKPGQPLVAPVQQPTAVTPLAAAAQALSAAPPTTVLDALIAKLRAETEDVMEDEATAPIRISIPFVPLLK